MTTKNAYDVLTWHHTLLACSSPLPVWTDHGFSFCFQELIFGCAANLVTLFILGIYSKCYSTVSKQKIKKSAQLFDLTKAYWLEMLPFLCIFLTLCQSLELLFGRYDENIGNHGHTLLYIFLQGLAWVSSCWVLHYDYAVVMADYWYLRLWWLLRPVLYVAYLLSLGKTSKVLWSREVIEDVIIFLSSAIFGVSSFYIGLKISATIHSKNREFPLLIDPLLDRKNLHNYHHLLMGCDYHKQLDQAQHYFNTHTKQEHSLWEVLLFTWVTPLMDLGTTRQLKYEDLLPLPEKLDPRICSKWLLLSWTEEQKLKRNQSSLFHAIYLVYRWQYMYIGFIKALNDASGFAGPLLLHAIIKSMENAGSKQNAQFSQWCAIGIGFMSVLRAFLGTQYSFLVAKLRLQVRASINMLIYYRALHASLSDRSRFSNGEIQTLMSVDAERIVNLCGSLHELWSLPLQMTVSLTFLYLQVKFSFVAGLLVIILLIPVNKMIATKIGVASQLMMKAKDERVRKIGEILTYIRTIKMYGWEDALCQRVMETRREEVKYLGVRKYLDAWCVYFWATTPILFSFFTFGLYSLLGYQLDAAIVFTSLSLFNMLITPLNSFPWVINGMIEAFVSLKRLSAFLLCSKSSHGTEKQDVVELRSSHMQSYEENFNDDCAISMRDATFSWDNHLKQNTLEHLKSLSLTIPKGKKILILGEVGSGKSSLLQAILGEMRQLSGHFLSQGKFGYVSQVPWIMSGTVRDNILLGKPFVKDRYESVLSACALDIDVKRMAGKDLCMIGEQGFNLSGGQRSRLALARAIYHDCNIFLFDDPLSSVDAGVANWLLNRVFSGPLLAEKTVVLSTYNAQAMSVADILIIMEDGQINWCGSAETFNKELQTCCDSSNEKSIRHHYVRTNLKETSIPFELKEEDMKKIPTNKEILPCIDENPVTLVEEEGRVQGAVRAMVYWIYAALVGKKWIAIILVSTTFMQMSRNGSDFWLSVWVDSLSTDRSSATAKTDNQLYLKVFLCLAVANSLFTAARAFSFAYGGLSAAFKVHESLLKRIVAAPSKFFSCNPKGRILNRFSSDQNTIDDSLPFIANILLANFFSLLGIFVILCLVQWTLMVILIPLGCIYISLQKYYRSTSRELRRLDSTSRSPIYSSFNEVLDGSTTIRAFKAQDMFFSKNEDFVALNQRASFSEVAASLWLSIRLQLLAAFIIFFISMMSSWGQQIKLPMNLATAGLVGLALSYATPMISLLSDLLSTFTETEKEMVSVERINEYMEVESEQQQAVSSSAEVGWPSKGTIEFHNVTLHYGTTTLPALKKMNFVIPGGTQVGIAGRTGAGKSSILNVLFRLTEPSIGVITIDGIDTSKVTLHDLRSKLAVVPQTPFLFEGTIRDNVDIHGISTDTRIWEILEKCHLKQTILSFGGLDANIKEGGEMLSLGQRQLLCLSRVFLQATKVICLDECTANVDPQTSRILQKAISSECKGKTVITIAHRVQSILNLDHVLILENGMLVEEGNPQALLGNQSSRLLSFAKASGI